MLARVPQSLIDRAAAYRDGINAYIDYVSGPGLAELPGEFVGARRPPDRRTGRSATPPGSGSSSPARCRPATATSSPTRWRSRDVGRKGFDLLHPVRTKGRLTTVPRSEGAFPAQPGRTRRDERRGYAKTLAYLRHTDLSSVTDTTAGLPQRAARPGADLARLLPHGGSFMWAIRDRESGHAYLYNGPQLGFSSPELFVEFELHSPSQPNLRGVSAAGIPVIGHRPQRPDRLGLHVRALRRGRPLRREADRARDVRVPRQARCRWTAATRRSPSTPR